MNASSDILSEKGTVPKGNCIIISRKSFGNLDDFSYYVLIILNFLFIDWLIKILFYLALIMICMLDNLLQMIVYFMRLWPLLLLFILCVQCQIV